jgi:hypothetical protein
VTDQVKERIEFKSLFEEVSGPLCANMSGTRCLSSIRVEGGGGAPHHAC